MSRRTVRPERVMALGFLVLITAGMLLLSTPASSASGESIGLGKALFTSVSAVCVTGLVVTDTGVTFSLFGQMVLLILIQTGGLGFMIFATAVMAAMGRRITLSGRMLIRESMNTATFAGLVKLAQRYGLMALIIELSGALLLSMRFVPVFGWGKGMYYSLWHAVSAFCNAGFDLFGGYQSLTAFSGDGLVLGTMTVLITLGGLGFSVMAEAFHVRSWKRLSLHTRLVVISSTVLLAAGSILFLLLEWDNDATLGPMSSGSKALNALLQSATMRTAGFNSVNLSSMRDASKLASILLMFTGASPASTGGGVKTTTVTVLFLIVASVIRGDDDVNVMGRRLPSELMRRALAIVWITLILLIVGVMLLTSAEKGRTPAVDILFETVSALTTTGVSSAGTPQLSAASKIVLIPMMYLGRVGPLTLAMAMFKRRHHRINRIHYPEESVTIG